MKLWTALSLMLLTATGASALSEADYASRADLEKDIRAQQTKMQEFITARKWPEVAQTGERLAERIGVLAAFSTNLPVKVQDRIGELVIEVNDTAGKLAETALSKDRTDLAKRVSDMDRLFAQIRALFPSP